MFPQTPDFPSTPLEKNNPIPREDRLYQQDTRHLLYSVLQLIVNHSNSIIHLFASPSS